MGLLRLAVLGSPEIFHDGKRLTFSLRKAQALLLYLAVEGGMHPRSKLAALLWPDSVPHEARTALRNALTLLRRLLDDTNASPGHPPHLLTEQELLGLNPQAPLELDLDVVQLAWKQAHMSSPIPAETQQPALVAQVQQAISLVRGPFLESFWLREETGFDEWHEQQQQQWQVRLLSLFERLSAWQEVTGEMEQGRLTLSRWLSLDPLSEEAARRLMRVYMTQGDASAALQVYASLRTRLAEELQIQPTAETVALAERIRANLARRSRTPTRPAPPGENQPSGELVPPLVGRATTFRQLVGSYQQARVGQPLAVLLVGEAGIGKTRLADEFAAWARAHGADVLVGHTFEMGGHLPYQPLMEALRRRLEAENAPEDLLEDLWLAELSRLLPELRVRYPDLPTPTEDELSARGRLFEAVARLLDALAQQAPLVLLVEDLHWLDGASLSLLRYLGHTWREHHSRVLFLGTLRQEGLAHTPQHTPQLAIELADLGRDLPLTQVPLPPLSQAEILQLLESLAGGGKRDLEPPESSGASPVSERLLIVLSQVLFARIGGKPLYVLETLKLLRERQWLQPHPTATGVLRLVPTEELEAALAQHGAERELLPPSVRAMIQMRLMKLSPLTLQLVRVSAVLSHPASAKRLWQIAELGVQEGVEALEEAVRSGILREEETEAGRPGTYDFTHDLMRDVVYTELGAARRLVLHQRMLAVLQSEGAQAAELAYHALAGGETEAATHYSVQAGDKALAIFAVEEAIGHYEQAHMLLQAQPPLQSGLDASEVEHLYVSLGQAYAFQNAWRQAQECYEELLAYAQQQPLTALGSRTLNRLAILAVQQGKDKSQVQALLEQAWHLAQSSHEPRMLAETAWNQAQIIGLVWDDPKHALSKSKQAVGLARQLEDKELQARSLSSLGWIHLRAGDFQEAIHLLKAAQAGYEQLSNRTPAAQELSLPSIVIGAPLTQPLTYRASEAMCWAVLAFTQVNGGHVQQSLVSGRRALALSTEIKNVWAQILSMLTLTIGLLDAGAYEEALVLLQHAVALARTLPPFMVNFPRLLTIQGNLYHAIQQWEVAHSTLEEAEALAETSGLGLLRVPILTRLCMHWAVAGDWEVASRYALQAITLRQSAGTALIAWDFYAHYETEALLHTGDERLAEEVVHRLGERLGSYRRFRLSYLRSCAVLASWQGHDEQAIGHLCEAAELAADLGLPEEQWQIQAALGRLYEARGKQEQARMAFHQAARTIQGLAEGLKEETLRACYLAGPQIQPVLQHTQRETSPVPQDHAEQNGR